MVLRAQFITAISMMENQTEAIICVLKVTRGEIFM